MLTLARAHALADMPARQSFIPNQVSAFVSADCITEDYRNLSSDTLYFMAVHNQTIACFEKYQQVGFRRTSALVCRRASRDVTPIFAPRCLLSGESLGAVQELQGHVQTAERDLRPEGEEPDHVYRHRGFGKLDLQRRGQIKHFFF